MNGEVAELKAKIENWKQELDDGLRTTTNDTHYTNKIHTQFTKCLGAQTRAKVKVTSGV